MPDESDVAIRVCGACHVAAVVQRLRQVVPTPVGELSTSVRSGTPIHVGRLHRLDHAEVEASILALLDQLVKMGVGHEIILGAETVPRQYLTNILERWREIGVEQEMLADLESDDPSQEARDWAVGHDQE